MQPAYGDSSLLHLKTSGSLHNINNQLFRITLLADLLSKDVTQPETPPTQVTRLVDEIKSAAFDVAKSGQDLMALLQLREELSKSSLHEPDLDSL